MFELFTTKYKMNQQFSKIDIKSQQEVEKFIATNEKFLRRTVKKVTSETNSVVMNKAKKALSDAIITYEPERNIDFFYFLDLKVRMEVAKQVFGSKEERIRTVEIKHFQEQLNRFGITVVELSNVSLSLDVKKLLFNISSEIYKHEDIMTKFLKYKHCPVKMINKIIHVPTEIYKTYRNYIIAILFMRIFDYKYLRMELY